MIKYEKASFELPMTNTIHGKYFYYCKKCIENKKISIPFEGDSVINNFDDWNSHYIEITIMEEIS